LAQGRRVDLAAGIVWEAEISAWSMEGFSRIFYGDDLSAPPPPLLGDFYTEPDDVVRGLTLDSTFMNLDGLEKIGSFSNVNPSWDQPLEERAGTGSTRFCEDNKGRNVPADPFFKFGKATKFLCAASPAEAGTWVLDFLEQEVSSRIIKVNDQKITIKAEVLHAGLTCTLKVYIWQHGCGSAVEFQRRNGDGIAFCGVYEKASSYLDGQLASTGFATSSSSTSFPIQEGPCFGEGCFVPENVEGAVGVGPSELFMKAASETPRLQDDVAAGILASVDRCPETLAEWCHPDALNVLLQLLASDRFACAFPAAQVLTRLVCLPEGRLQCFNHGLVNLILPRLYVQATGIAVWLLLANLTHTLVSEYASQMTRKESGEAAAIIAAALQLEPMSCACPRTVCVGQQLREALSLLS